MLTKKVTISDINHFILIGADTALDLLYPPKCPLCGEILAEKHDNACRSCVQKLVFTGEITCAKCGKDIYGEEIEYCEDCLRLVRSYVKGFPAVRYDENIHNCIMNFKYHNKRNYADFLAKLIIRRHGREMIGLGAQALVPVPVHKERLKTRGYNQAEELAIKLSKYLDVPVDSTILERCRKTLPQKKLGNIDREKNLKSAFISRAKSVKYDKVILVDDIYTTGATIESCTKVLHDAGVSEVFYTSVCIGKGF